jgi:hypothetical protein
MSKIDERLLQSVVLLKRQYLLTRHLIESRSGALREFEIAVTAGQQQVNHVIEVYNFAFALIDHLVRYQKIAHSIPKLNQKNNNFRSLNAAMGELKEVRNQHQHLSNHIINNFTGPLLGSVSWASEQNNFIAAFQDIGRQRSFPGIAFDTHLGKFTHEFCYVYGEKYYDLKKAITGLHEFNEYIDSNVFVEADGKPFKPEDLFVALRMQFQVNQKGE